MTLEALIEFCQGPCVENQNCIINNESNIFNQIIWLLTHSKWDHNLYEKLLKFLFALNESRQNFYFLDNSINPEIFINLASKIAYGYYSNSDKSTEVGHDFYILCSQLAKNSHTYKEKLNELKIVSDEDQAALEYYESKTAQVEIVKNNGNLDQITFPIPKMCGYLNKFDKLNLFRTCERDEQGSKIPDFFEKCEELYEKISWDREKSRSYFIPSVADKKSIFSVSSFALTLILNLMIVLFYPFGCQYSSFRLKENANCILILALLPAYFRSKLELKFAILFAVVTIFYSDNINEMINILGLFSIAMKSLEIMCSIFYIGFRKLFHNLAFNRDLQFQMIYLAIIALGTFLNPLIYSILVS